VLLQPRHGRRDAEGVLSGQVGWCARQVSLAEVLGWRGCCVSRLAWAIRPLADGARKVGISRVACNGRPVSQAPVACAGCSNAQGLGRQSFNGRLVFERRVLAKLARAQAGEGSGCGVPR
jgi:hypothetical protein